jgi:enterochelin esterase-like enzyme
MTQRSQLQAASAPRLSPNPHPRLRVYPQFHSNFLPDDRDLIVYVPEGYDTGDRRYPVLYLQDGQNLFDGATSYVPGKTWEVHTTADRLIEAGEIEPLIIVGVYNTGDHRIREYTPTSDPRYGGGGAALYGRMLTEEIHPLIARLYRTRSGPEHTGLGGSSLGGLVSLYLGLLRPDLFGKLAILSPSVWWDRKAIFKLVRQAQPEPRPRIWLDMGTSEGKRILQDSAALHELLLQKGWVDGRDLVYRQIAGGSHDETSWAGRVGPFLQFLFPAGESHG